MKKSEWVSVEYEPACESYMIDLFFECAPPGNEEIHFALGEKELRELLKKCVHAIKTRRDA